MRIRSWLKGSLHALPLTAAAPIPNFCPTQPQRQPLHGQRPLALAAPPTSHPQAPIASVTPMGAVAVNGKVVPMAQVERYAPIVQFHPAERYLPCSIEFLLQNATLVDGLGHTIAASPTQEQLQALPNKPARVLLHKANYGGETVDSVGRVQAPMYVSVQVPNDHRFVDINYLFLFIYNGAQTARMRIPGHSYNVELPHFAEHEGDIESITVRLSPDFNTIEHVRLEGHGNPHYFPPHKMTLQGDRPVIRSALNSHASHNNGTQPWEVTTKLSAYGFGIEFIDVLDHRGAVWAPTREHLVPVGLDATGKPLGNQTWAAYGGFIGAHWRNKFQGTRGVGGAHLALWQRVVADIIAYAIQGTGVTRWFADSNGTNGLRDRPYMKGDRPLKSAIAARAPAPPAHAWAPKSMEN